MQWSTNPCVNAHVVVKNGKSLPFMPYGVCNRGKCVMCNNRGQYVCNRGHIGVHGRCVIWGVFNRGTCMGIGEHVG